MRPNNSRLMPRLLVALVITAVATGLVVRATWQEDSWQALRSFDLRFVLGGVGLLIAMWIVDAVRMHALTRALGYNISPALVARTNFVGYFLSAVTPFTAGGGASQIYSLSRAGLTVGHGTVVVLVGGLIAQFVLAASGIFIVFGLRIAISGEPAIEQIIRAGVLIYAFAIIAIVWLAWHIDKGRKFVETIISRVLRLFMDEEKVARAAATVDKTITDMHRGLQEMMRRRSLWTLVAALAGIVQNATLFAIVPVLARGLGVEAAFWPLIAIQVPIHLLASALPTPGGSGGLEFGLASALLQYVPAGQIGIIVLTWRLITFYFVLAVGGFVFLQFIRGEIGRAATGAATPEKIPSNRTPVSD